MQKIFGDVLQGISANGVLRYLFDTSVTVSVIVVFLLLIRPFMKKMPRKGMYILWLMVAVRILCPISIGGIYNVMPEQLGSKVSQTNQNIKIEKIASRFANPQEKKTTGGSEVSHAPAQKSYDHQSTMSQTTVSVAREGREELVQTNTGKSFWTEMGVDLWLLMIWGGGAFGLLLFMIVSMIRNYRRFSDARWLYDNVYVHPLLDNSFVQGLFSPRIYISEKIAEQDREYILCHERKHIKRRDYIVKPIMFVLVSVYWFNPFMWIAYYFMMKDMEVSCDEAVIRELGEEARVKYSYLLVFLATGKRGVLDQNAAFSVGVVKDRIMSVMKYRKPTVLTSVILMIAVVLCSCSIASTPGDAPVPDIQKGDKGTYKEQSFFPDKEQIPELESYHMTGMSVLDYKDDITIFPLDYEKGAKKGMICKYIWSGMGWEREEASWIDKVEKMYEGKQVQVGGYFYADDGCLYLNIYDTIVPTDVLSDEGGESAHMGDAGGVLEDGTGKYEASGELGNEEMPKGEYETDCYIILKINEKEGTVDTIQIPIEGDSGLACQMTDFEVLGDGSILQSNMIYQDASTFKVHFTVYNSNTGEKTAENDLMAGAIACPHAGDDFLVYEVRNQETGMIEINVCEPNTGEKEYSLDTGISFQEQTEDVHGQDFTIGVKGNTILMATREGIFEAEYGEREFTKIVDGNAKGVYYLSERKYLFIGDIYKGSDGNYMMFRSNSKYESWDLLCYYEKQ